MSRPPCMNGTKTHPLSEHALAELRSIVRQPTPRQTINAGVANRLEREELVETVKRPSPFKTHKGALIDYLQVTEAGRARALQP